MVNVWKSISLILLLFLLFFVPSCSYSENGSQIQQYNDLVNKHNALVQQYNNLFQQNNEYREDRVQLLNEVSRYQNELETALLKIIKFNTALVNYQDELETALEGAIVPPYIVMNGRKASFSYRNLSNDIESWSLDVEVLEANTFVGTFMRNLTISDMNRLGLTVISKRFINGSKYVNLGGKSTSIDLRPYIVKDNFLNVPSDFYSRHADDESKIREVWNMVTQLCPYVGELKDTPRLPLETLLFGGGDCEDVAVLTASILRAMSSSWTVQLVYMDLDNPTDFKNLNHVAVFVDTGTYKAFVESTQGSNMSPFQSVDGFYVDVP